VAAVLAVCCVCCGPYRLLWGGGVPCGGKHIIIYNLLYGIPATGGHAPPPVSRVSVPEPRAQV